MTVCCATLAKTQTRTRAGEMVTMITVGGDLQPGCLADWLMTGLGQPQINPISIQVEKKELLQAHL